MKHGNGNTRGVSLVELMVAVVIGMVLILAITQLMVRQDRIRRSVTGINDVALSSAAVSATLDREVRTAGSGIADAWAGFLGCVLHVARNGAQVLPRTGAFPAPFASVPGTIAGAAFVIHGGAGPGGSDVLQIMGGNSGIADVGYPVIGRTAAADRLAMRHSLGIAGGDLVFLSEPGRGCMVQQVSAGFVGGAANILTFGGAYAAAEIDGLQLEAFSRNQTTNLALLGNTGNSTPRFLLFGHDANGALFSYDLLNIAGDDRPVVLGEGLVMLRAVYGVDEGGNDGIIDTWRSPTEAGYTAADLTNPANQQRLRRIFAIRVGMLIAGDLVERESVSPSTLTLFEDLPSVSVQRALSDDEQKRRVRIYEFTVPLRNPVMSTRRIL